MKAKLKTNTYSYIDREKILKWEKGTLVDTLHSEPKDDMMGHNQCYYCRMPDGSIDEIMVHQLIFINDISTKDIDWEQRRYELAKDIFSKQLKEIITSDFWIENDKLICDSIDLADRFIQTLRFKPFN